MKPEQDHPQRYALANELHARPFPMVGFPSRAAYLALTSPKSGQTRDHRAERAHLLDLLDRFGAAHPPAGATHYSGQIGKHFLKWESHTEFTTFTLFGPGLAEHPFDGETFGMFPQDWLEAAPGKRITSALIRIEARCDDALIAEKLHNWMVPESLAVSSILDGAAVIAADFRIDPAGHIRFAIFCAKTTGKARLGRIVQRVTEIETYKTMSMLGLLKAREMGAEMARLDAELISLVSDMSAGEAEIAEATLERLLRVASRLEAMLAKATFRFGASSAYSAIVGQRTEVLRESRFLGRQTWHEFMARRFDPAMRFVASTEARLTAMSQRAARAGDLLRTRVDVARQSQNQKVLESMDKRADLQLSLQKTVEGLSVVAISYYALNLLLYALIPLGAKLGIDKIWLAAGLTPMVVTGVWAAIRRIHRHME